MVTLYELSIPVFIKNLKTLSKLLEAGNKHVSGQTETLLNARLIEDMKPLPYQIQRVSDTAKLFAQRVAKITPVPMDDTEKTFPDLQERIAKTIKVLESVKPEDINDKEDTEVTLKTRFGDKVYTSKSYLLEFALPNFFFHVVTAYALLRKEGVPVGKEDFLDRQ